MPECEAHPILFRGRNAEIGTTDYFHADQQVEIAQQISFRHMQRWEKDLIQQIEIYKVDLAIANTNSGLNPCHPGWLKVTGANHSIRNHRRGCPCIPQGFKFVELGMMSWKGAREIKRLGNTRRGSYLPRQSRKKNRKAIRIHEGVTQLPENESAEHNSRGLDRTSEREKCLEDNLSRSRGSLPIHHHSNRQSTDS
jgi:hypothetical protein